MKTAISIPDAGPNWGNLALFTVLLGQAWFTTDSWAATYSGNPGYIEYRPGTLPIIISAPHGGTLTPAEIPDRTYGTFTLDTRTAELAEAADTAIFELFGQRPHIIICHLRRTKLDANRDSIEGAQGNPLALQAWHEFHEFIDSAKAASVRSWGAGHYIDLHAHGHALQLLELGYQLTAARLDESDSAIEAYAGISSIRTLSNTSPATFAELLRGRTSFGGLMQDQGFPSVPSPAHPSPDTNPYFNGGYNTGVHGSRNGGPVSGFQIESNFTGVRDSPANRKLFGRALARSLQSYLVNHYRMTFGASGLLEHARIRPRAGGKKWVLNQDRTGDIRNPQAVLNLLGIRRERGRLAPGLYILAP